jgi:hypothetical protein
MFFWMAVMVFKSALQVQTGRSECEVCRTDC